MQQEKQKKIGISPDWFLVYFMVIILKAFLMNCFCSNNTIILPFFLESIYCLALSCTLL